MAWSRDHDGCTICGTTDVAHAAHGRCRTCDSRMRAPTRWPSWLRRCLRCERSRHAVSYRKYGLCVPCCYQLRTDVTELRSWRVRFRAARPRPLSDAQRYNAMALEAVQLVGLQTAAADLQVMPKSLARW